MRELIACWQNTRAIVLIALCAALFVAVLIPFKLLTIVPGITEVRPAAVLPIVFSFLFGPIAAWGAAFGNLIGDFFGTIGPGSLFGIAGNFVYGYVPYRLMLSCSEPGAEMRGPRGWSVFLLAILMASALCAMIIALGVDFLNIVPFPFLVHTIFLNNVILSLVLAPVLIVALRRRIDRMKLGYRQLLPADRFGRPVFGPYGILVLAALAGFVYAVMMVPAWMALIPWIGSQPKLFALAASVLISIASLLLL